MTHSLRHRLTHILPSSLRSNNAGLKKYGKNTGWLFFGRIFALGISFFVGIYIARYLGPAQYGLLNYIVSFVGLFGFLASFGIDSIVSREFVRDHARKDEIIGTAFFIKLAGAVSAIVAITAFSLATTHDIPLLLLTWVFSLTYIPQAFGVVDTYFQSQVLSRKSVSVQIFAAIASTVFKAGAVLAGAGLAWFLAAYVFEAALTAFGLLITFRTYGNSLRRWRFNSAMAKRLLTDAWPLMLSGAAIGIYTKIDQVIIHTMLGDVSTGLYAVAVKLSEVWYFIPMLICTSLTPAIVNALPEPALFERRLRGLYILMLALAIVIAGTISLLAHPIVQFLFGNAYMGAIPVLRIYAWAGISVFLGVAFGLYLLAENFTKISFYTTLFGAVSNVLLNIMLIPTYGMIGSAVATVVSYTIATFGIFLFKEPREHARRILGLSRATH